MARGRPRKSKVPLTPEQKAINRERNSIKKQFLKENYNRETSVCCYCNCTAEDVYQVAKVSKRIGTRGNNLEVERKEPNETYGESYRNKNLALACYICNNTKSDIFTAEEFKPIADAIKDVIEKKLKNDIQTT